MVQDERDGQSAEGLAFQESYERNFYDALGVLKDVPGVTTSEREQGGEDSIYFSDQRGGSFILRSSALQRLTGEPTSDVRINSAFLTPEYVNLIAGTQNFQRLIICDLLENTYRVSPTNNEAPEGEIAEDLQSDIIGLPLQVKAFHQLQELRTQMETLKGQRAEQEAAAKELGVSIDIVLAEEPQESREVLINTLGVMQDTLWFNRGAVIRERVIDNPVTTLGALAADLLPAYQAAGKVLNDANLAERFSNHLISQASSAAADLVFAADILHEMFGDEFDSLPNAEQLKKIAQIGQQEWGGVDRPHADSPVKIWSGSGDIDRLLQESYQRYLDDESEASRQRYEWFFRLTREKIGPNSAHTRFPNVNAPMRIDLTTDNKLYEFISKDADRVVRHTFTQIALGKALGLFQTDFSDLVVNPRVRRINTPFKAPDILWEERKAIVREDPDSIPAVVQLDRITGQPDYQGSPIAYGPMPTNYPGVAALIKFHIDEGRAGESPYAQYPLADVVAIGKASPEITLLIPKVATLQF